MKNLAQFRTLCCSNSLVILITIAWLINTSCSESPEKRPSPLRSDSTQIGDNFLQVEYSSPSVRGRKIFGLGDDYLVEYGKIWRTGANEATVFSTEKDITIDTFKLPKGKYALFTIPNENAWEIILNEEWNQWGSYYRIDSLDLLRLLVKPQTYDSSQEKMQLFFEENSLKFRWEKVGWSVAIN